MAQRVVVAIPVSWASTHPLPPICAYTGRLADSGKDHHVAGDRPRWTLLLLLPAVLPYVVLADFWATRLKFRLPLARSTRRRWLVANAVTASSLVMGVTALVLGREGNPLLLGVAAGHCVLFVWGLTALFGRQQVPRIKGGMLILPCVHPAFAEAVRREFTQRRRTAEVIGWDGAAAARYPTLSESLAS